MHRTAKVVLGVLGGAAVAAYAGFPVRAGLTTSQARVSMPGDLLLPSADFQADRAATVDAPVRRVWPALTGLKDVLEDALDTELHTVYRDVPDLVVWRAAMPLRDDRRDEDLADVSIAVTLMEESPETTRVHVRERYKTTGTRHARAAAVGSMVATAVSIPLHLAAMRRAARQSQLSDSTDHEPRK